MACAPDTADDVALKVGDHALAAASPAASSRPRHGLVEGRRIATTATAANRLGEIRAE